MSKAITSHNKISKLEIPSEWLEKADACINKNKLAALEKQKLDEFIVSFYGTLNLQQIHEVTGWSLTVVWQHVQKLIAEGRCKKRVTSEPESEWDCEYKGFVAVHKKKVKK